MRLFRILTRDWPSLFTTNLNFHEPSFTARGIRLTILAALFKTSVLSYAAATDYNLWYRSLSMVVPCLPLRAFQPTFRRKLNTHAHTQASKQTRMIRLTDLLRFGLKPLKLSTASSAGSLVRRRSSTVLSLPLRRLWRFISFVPVVQVSSNNISSHGRL